MDIGQFIKKKIINERGELVYEDKIYGAVRTDSWDPSFNSSFETLFLKAHKEYLESFNFHSKDGLILPFGKYEPNVFRRKIIKRIHDEDKFNCSVEEILSKVRFEENDKMRLYNFLEKNMLNILILII